jgi:hypothetical protein
VVWIKSGAVSFKFDKNNPLGMIAPEWADFPTHTRLDERTMFCFKIPDPKDQSIVQARLMDLKPQLLLFLRQLRCIEVRIQNKSDKTQNAFKLLRSDDELSGMRQTQLHHDATVSRALPRTEAYLVCQRTVPHMPADPKRSGVTQTDILIAFPVDHDLCPVIQNQMTFNYLPIRDYGFPFVLQADFLLSANREDILKDNRWNEALVASFIELFADSVLTFNKKEVLQYAWPRYVRSMGNAWNTVFQHFFPDLLHSLQSWDIVISQAGKYAAPSALRSVPARFMDGADPPTPLLVGDLGLEEYASPNYEDSDLGNLRIQPVDEGKFLAMLRNYINKQSSSYRAEDATWHSRIAEALLSIGAFKKNGISKLSVIPLRDERWISAKDGPVHFAELGNSLVVPKG